MIVQVQVFVVERIPEEIFVQHKCTVQYAVAYGEKLGIALYAYIRVEYCVELIVHIVQFDGLVKRYELFVVFQIVQIVIEIDVAEVDGFDETDFVALVNGANCCLGGAGGTGVRLVRVAHSWLFSTRRPYVNVLDFRFVQ